MLLTNANVPLKEDNGSLNPGEVYLANSARFVEANFSEPLTTYATGWRDSSNIQDTLDFIAPPVQTPRRFEYIKWSNDEPFILDVNNNLIRAIGSEFKRLEYTGTKLTGSTKNKGLTIRVDMDNVNDIPNWRNTYVDRIMQRLLRSELKAAGDLASAAANNSAKTWDTTALKDPDQDVLTEIIAGTDVSGVRPNRVLYNAVSWNKRGLSHRAQNTAGGFASAGLTPQALAPILGVDSVLVSQERYFTAGALAAATKSKVIGDIVLIFFANQVQTPEDPSNLKRFISPTMGGTPFRVYEQQINAKLIDITVEYYSDIVVTTTLGLRKLTIS